MPANVVSSWPKGPPHELAIHLISYNCALAHGIAAELYSFEKMLWMLYQDTEMLRPLLAEKLRSV
jgi:hypothetical protein